MADSAPEFAIEALDTALKARTAGAEAVRADPRGLGSADAGAVKIPSLTFKFSAPNFLSARSRWVLFLSLDLIAVVALLLAWDMVKSSSTSEGFEWVGPPMLTVVVAGFTLAFAFATVLGFGKVELSSSIGEGQAAPVGGFEVTDPVPPDKGEDVAVDTQLEVTFSEAIDASTLTPDSFKLKNTADGAAVAGTISTDDDKLTGRFAPGNPLAAGTKFEAEITTGLKSANGTALAAAKTWTFTTAAAGGG